MSRHAGSFLTATLAAAVLSAMPLGGAETFLLPTANRAIYHFGAMQRYFAPTPGRSWESGTFGCVRSEGWQFHEGIDILTVQRDARGEPTDPIMATAEGVVVYVNDKTALSNYGKYIVIRHRIEGLEIFSLYSHLSRINPGIEPGRRVEAGQTIGVMGRTANTRTPITQDRAHLHFELNFLVNDRFPEWYRKNFAGQRNDHGAWNGQNLIGLDPRLLLLQQRRATQNFSLVNFVRSQPEMCRVWVRQKEVSWARRFPALVLRNPLAEKEGIDGYEIALNYYGLPCQWIPRTASETRHLNQINLLTVNVAEYKRNPCRQLVEKKGSQWGLSRRGREFIDLLTH